MDILEDIFLLLIIIAPGILAAFIQEWLKPVHCGAKRFIARVIVYDAVINLLVFVLLALWGHGLDSFSSLFSAVLSILKYGFASFVFALIIPSLLVLLQLIISNAINKNDESNNKLNSF